MSLIVTLMACSPGENASGDASEDVPTALIVENAGLVVEKIWARPTLVPGQPGGIYMAITNHTDTDDRLINIASTRADRAEMHENVFDGNIVHMVRLDIVNVPAGTTMIFQPGQAHIMLFGLDAPLVKGDQVPLILTFEQAGKLAVTAMVGDLAHGTDHHDH